MFAEFSDIFTFLINPLINTCTYVSVSGGEKVIFSEHFANDILQSLIIYINYFHEKRKVISFICYVTVLHISLGHCLKSNLTYPILITTFRYLIFDQRLNVSLETRLGS